MNYERGLDQLKFLARGTDWQEDFLIHEGRLRENLRDERRYGSSEQSRATRAQIVDQLNRLALDHSDGVSFNDLCLSPQRPLIPDSQAEKDFPINQHGKAVSSSVSTSTASALQHSRAFIGFNPKDRRFLDELHRHLAYYEQKHLVHYWDSTKTVPGTKWRVEEANALHFAKVAILLVSADFLASDFIRTYLPALLKSYEEDKVTILCVLLRPCGFKDSELEPFKWINDQPLSGMKQSKREEVWNQVAMLVRDIQGTSD